MKQTRTTKLTAIVCSVVLCISLFAGTVVVSAADTQLLGVDGWNERVLGAGTLAVDGSYSAAEMKETAIKAGEESIVLLKNENSALPLRATDKVAVFGGAQLWESVYSTYGYHFGGIGSGTMWCSPEMSPIDAIKQEANAGKFSLYTNFSDAYASNPTTYVPTAAEYSAAKAAGVNKAVMFITRLNGEQDGNVNPLGDMQIEAGGWYLTDAEKSLLKQLNANFEHVIVVLNTGNVMDTNWIKDGIDGTQVADAAMFSWYGGNYGSTALANVLSGDANPSGKLAQTAAPIENYPTTDDFYNQAFAAYTEDVFVGYRYFETFNVKTNYEFGFGLSYTDFTIDNLRYSATDTDILVKATVKNVGTRAGKEVVQVYFSAPQMGTGNAKLSKPAKELAGYTKTQLLAPGQSQEVTITFPISELASYDDTGVTGKKAAWVMEDGDYAILVGNSVKNLKQAGVYQQDGLRVVEQLTTKLTPQALGKRLLADGTYETLTPGTVEQPVLKAETSAGQQTYANLITYNHVKAGQNTVEQLVSQMTIAELATFTVPTKHSGAAQGSGVGGSLAVQDKYGVPVYGAMDGPAGPGTGNWAFPCETALACTWNLDILADFGTLSGEFCTDAFWLAPGVNMHRSPLGGRNYEYFSEDALVTGLCAAAITVKCQALGVPVAVKHYVANDKELARGSCDSRVSERAMREVYLLPFEFLSKIGKAASFMMGYNVVNGVQIHSYSELLQLPREEWGWDGMYMSDWGDLSCRTTAAYIAGSNIAMGNNTQGEASGTIGDSTPMVTAYNNGQITRSLLEENAATVIRALLKRDCPVEYGIGGNQPTVVTHDGVAHVFAAADGKVQYKGATYNAYTTFESAWKAMKDLGGVIVTEGTQDLYTDTTVTKPIKVIGADANAVLNHNGNYKGIYGDITFDELTLNFNSSGTISLFVDRVTFGPNLKKTGAYINISAFRGVNNEADTNFVLDMQGGSFEIVSAAHEFATVLPDYVSNVKLIKHKTAYVNSAITCSKQVYGSVTVIVNSKENWNVPRVGPFNTNPTGKASVIFNNGTTGVTVDNTNGNIDYILNVATGGTADVKVDGTATTAPTFIITPPEGKVPFVGGAELFATNGEYLYTPTNSGTYAITFGDPTTPRVYTIDGEKTVFAAADGKVIYRSTTYPAYSTLALAYAAIKNSGGTIVVEGTHTMLSGNETAQTDRIKMIGLGANNTTLGLNNYQSINGSWEFYDLTLKAHANETVMSGSNLLFGTGTASNGNIWLRGALANSDGSVTTQQFLSNTFRVNVLDFDWSITAGVNLYRVFDGGKMAWDLRIDNKADTVNNMTYVFNNVSNFDNKNLNVSKNPLGKLSLVFNNGVSDLTVNDGSGYVDYRINVAAGGYAYLKTDATATTAPTFVITHKDGLAPVVNGQQLKKVDGEYRYTPTAATTNITFVSPAQVYEIDGEKVAFAAADGQAEYDGVTYDAYKTFALAFAAVKSGGTIMVEGIHAMTANSEASATDNVKVVGISGTNATLTINTYQVIDGSWEFYNVKIATTGADSTLAAANLVIGEGTTYSGYIWLRGAKKINGITTQHLNSETFRINLLDFDWGTQEDAQVYRIFDNTTHFGWDLRIDNKVTTVANVTYVFNQLPDQPLNVKAAPKGALSLVFNDGKQMAVNDANGYVDYQVNVEEGGYAYLKTFKQDVPVFTVTPPEGKVPVINGKDVPMVDGEYQFTPTAKQTDVQFRNQLVSVNMLSGAEVRFSNPTGLRFTTEIEGLDKLPAGATYKAYTLIVPIDYVEEMDEFTKEAFDKTGTTYLKIDLLKRADVDNNGIPDYHAAIVNIRSSNFTRKFAARTCVEITYADGTTETVYSAYDPEKNARSVQYVAQMELTYGNPNELEEKVLLDFGAVKS